MKIKCDQDKAIVNPICSVGATQFPTPDSFFSSVTDKVMTSTNLTLLGTVLAVAVIKKVFL